MESNVNYTIVGVFVVTLIAAIVLSIIWLSSGFTSITYKTYEVQMTESVSGLNIDAAVEYNGVNVGTVKTIKLNRKDPHIVDLLLNVNAEVPVTRGTVATLSTRGITGVVFIALKDTGLDNRPLLAIKKHPYPIIPTAPSIFVRLDTALTQISSSFKNISESMRGLLDKENLESIKDTLKSLKRVTGTLANNSEKLNTIILNTQKASENLAPLLKNSSVAVKAVEMQTLPSFNQLILNLNDVSRTLIDISTQLKQNPSILIRGAVQGPPGPGEGK
jgi:phospholipid/cholesterol/gamma-HCH transport system substrate-binding protein